MKIILLLLLNFLLFISMAFGQEKPKTILGIFAHPDDENMIGHVLAKYARLGHKVYIIIATDGKDGTRVTDIPAGDSLGTLWQKETICACEKLGINPPIYLHIDKLDTKFGVRPYLNGHKKLMEELKKYFQKLKPDILITFGPDGEYGHSEHIVTGATVVDLLLKEGWVDKYPLYFPIDKKSDVIQGDGNSYADEKYLNVVITYSDSDELKSFEAAKCYITQFKPEEVMEWNETATADKKNTKVFRRFSVFKGMNKDFDFKK